VTDFFKYDFGYTWPWSYEHLIAAVVFLLVALLAWRLAWPGWTRIVSAVAAMWALAAFVTFDTGLS